MARTKRGNRKSKGTKRPLEQRSSRADKKRKKQRKKSDFVSPDRDDRGFREKTIKNTEVFGSSAGSMKKCDIYDSPVILRKEEFREASAENSVPPKHGDPCMINFFLPGCPSVEKKPEPTTTTNVGKVFLTCKMFNPIEKPELKLSSPLKDECESMDEEDDEDISNSINGVIPENPDNSSESSSEAGFIVKSSSEDGFTVKSTVQNDESESEDDPWSSEEIEEGTKFMPDTSVAMRENAIPKELHSSTMFVKTYSLRSQKKPKSEAKPAESLEKSQFKKAKAAIEEVQPKFILNGLNGSVRIESEYNLRSRGNQGKLTKIVAKGFTNGPTAAIKKSKRRVSRLGRHRKVKTKQVHSPEHAKELRQRKVQAGKKLKKISESKVRGEFAAKEEPSAKPELIAKEEGAVCESKGRGEFAAKEEPSAKPELIAKEEGAVYEGASRSTQPSSTTNEQDDVLKDEFETELEDDTRDAEAFRPEPFDINVKEQPVLDLKMDRIDSKNIFKSRADTSDNADSDDDPWADDDSLSGDVAEEHYMPLEDEVEEDNSPGNAAEEDNLPGSVAEEDSARESDVGDQPVKPESVTKAEKPSEDIAPIKRETYYEDDPWADDDENDIAPKREEDDPWADDEDPWADDPAKTENKFFPKWEESAEQVELHSQPFDKRTKVYPTWRRRIVERLPDGRRQYSASVRSWKAEELEVFFIMLARYGINLNRIAEVLPKKTRRSVKNKFRQLNKADSIYVKIDQFKEKGRPWLDNRLAELKEELAT